MLEYAFLIISAFAFAFAKIPITSKQEPVTWGWFYKEKQFPLFLLYTYFLIIVINLTTTGELFNPIGTAMTTLTLLIAINLISISYVKVHEFTLARMQDAAEQANDDVTLK